MVLLVKGEHVGAQVAVANLLDPLVEVLYGFAELDLEPVALGLGEASHVVLNHVELFDEALLVIHGVAGRDVLH